MRFLAATCAALALMAAAPAFAHDLHFVAQLRGDTPPTDTGSQASGVAHLTVHPHTGTVDVSIEVEGITEDGLWDHLVDAPVGPIHLHLYGGNDHDHSGASELLLPFPYGSGYTSTDAGFSVDFDNYAYAPAAALAGSKASFAQFMAALKSGAVVLNIHTDNYNDGEISGVMVADEEEGEAAPPPPQH